LLNFDNRLNSVFTLAHELGHSMHAHYTKQCQPFVYGDADIFTAEIASTVNEILLAAHLRRTGNAKQQAYLLTRQIDDARATLFTQTLFAEFELLAHKHVEAGDVLTVDWLNQTWLNLQKTYNQPTKPTRNTKYGWSVIPHFYRDFYVYQYATGYAAATALVQKILASPAAAKNYIGFLKSGSSDYPIELLKRAGVDMTHLRPVASALEVFDNLVGDLDALL
jgi:oligoendopeptidase F